MIAVRNTGWNKKTAKKTLRGFFVRRREAAAGCTKHDVYFTSIKQTRETPQKALGFLMTILMFLGSLTSNS